MTQSRPGGTASAPIDAKEQAEGSRDIVDRELARQAKPSERDLRGRPEGAGGPADPSADPAWEKHVETYFDRSPMSDESVEKATHELKPEREP